MRTRQRITNSLAKLRPSAYTDAAMKKSILTIGVLCIAIAVCLSIFSSKVSAQPEPKAIAAEQYKVVTLEVGAERDSALLETQLNKLAQEGWKFRAMQMRWLVFAK